MHFVSTLESATRTQSKCKCYSDGKKALGWDFFLLEIDEMFVDKFRDIYPDIEKQEAGEHGGAFGTLDEQAAKEGCRYGFPSKVKRCPSGKHQGVPTIILNTLGTRRTLKDLR